VDSHGRTIFVADAHRDDGKRFVVRADEKLTAFLELESVIRARGSQPLAERIGIRCRTNDVASGCRVVARNTLFVSRARDGKKTNREYEEERQQLHETCYDTLDEIAGRPCAIWQHVRD
jgi:hypothetical protein